MRKFEKRFILLLLAVLLAAACAPAGGENSSPEPEVTTLIYATLNPGQVNRMAVKQFNSQHEDVQIEVRDYSGLDENSSGGKNGRDRLLTEIMSGQIPDIMDFDGQLPYRQMAEKGYLEDLWPYIENDPDLGRDGVLEAPLRAAEINGKLYTIFDSVTIRTLVGAESMVGNRTSWTIAELWEAFANMPENSTILEYYETRRSMFDHTFIMTLDSYVDWKTGHCSFDSEGFRASLEFISNYPLEFECEWSTNEELTAEISRRRREGRQMLSETAVGHFDYVQILDAEFGGRAAFIGYPVEDGSVGSSFHPKSVKLAISSTCQDKEAAWDFVRQMLLPRIGSEQLERTFGEYMGVFPINRADYEKMKLQAGALRNYKDREFYIFNSAVPLKLHAVTEDEFSRLENFFNSIEKIDLCDSAIYDIVWDQAGPYFAGDKTLDETVELIQRRVTLYVNEQK